jgi:protoheme IX farnesyltransferase
MPLLPYYRLLKPRVMVLVVFTGIVGLLLAPGHISLAKALIAILCIATGSGAAGALNMWYERDIDALMERTKTRPLPQGVITPLAALVFSLTLAISSVLIMYIFVNSLAAFYLAFAILFYVIIYTIWLKRITPQNIVIGGIAGALPPVIGWAAVTNDTTWLPLALFGIIFLWTPPHFWALSLYHHDDYAKANIPMLPLVAGIEETKNQILYYIFILVGLTLSLNFWETMGIVYTTASCILGLAFLILGVRLKVSSSPKDGLHLFFFSIIYLFVLFLAMIINL